MPSGVSIAGPEDCSESRLRSVHNHAVVKTAILRLVETGQQSKLAALRHEKRLTYGELAIH
jgi:hypothetical protein